MRATTKNIFNSRQITTPQNKYELRVPILYVVKSHRPQSQATTKYIMLPDYYKYNIFEKETSFYFYKFLKVIGYLLLFSASCM